MITDYSPELYNIVKEKEEIREEFEEELEYVQKVKDFAKADVVIDIDDE